MSSFEFNRNSISVQSINSSVSQTSLLSSNNSRAFDFDGLEESLVDNDLNESIESLNDNSVDTDDTRRLDDTNDIQSQREESFHRIRDALIRDSINRSEEDLDLIHNFLSLIVRQNTAQTTATTTAKTHSLVNKDFQTRRLLAKHMVLAEIESRDTRVLTHGERLDAYCVVACGSLRHVVTGCHELSSETTETDDSCVDCVDGECPTRQSGVVHPIGAQTSQPKVRYLTVGDEFGASLDDRVVFGEIYTNEDFVWVLCVPHVLFDEICGEKSFKTLFDDKNEKIIEIRNQFTNELIRATKPRLLDLLFAAADDPQHVAETPIDDTQETQFISDFLLTFRLFWSRDQKDIDCVEELMDKVLLNLKNDKNVEKNVKIVLFWMSNHFQDFDKRLLLAFEAHLKSKIHRKLFYFTLSTKSRERHVTLTRSDRAAGLPFTLIGGYECSSRLFVSDVTDESETDLQRGDRLITINGVDCHVMEVTRALQLCKASTHLSLFVRFDPNLFHLLLDGQISRNSEAKRHLNQTDGLKTSCGQLLTTHSSFASLKPIQQLSSQSLSSSVMSTNNNNNWKQKVRQIVQNVTTNHKMINNNNNNNIHNNSCVLTTPTTTTPTLTTAPNETPEIMKIYYESDFRYLPIHVTTTARECIQLALIEFQLNSGFSSRDFALYEYKLIDKTTATSAVKRLSDNYQNLVHNLSLNSRIYLKCISGQNSTLNDSDITREITRESHVNSLLTLDGEAIARELTERDFELFCRIESQQFVYDLTSGDDPTDDRRRELKEFEEKTNREMFWTINEILLSCNSWQKRVKTVKQLIRIALHCKQLNNFNSLFAITSGLSHQSIQRLKTLWERIPHKSINKLKKLYQLMDPSKNFGAFRSQLRHCCPPIIPFFPLVKKDLSFIFLANQTFDSDHVLINWDKMRLLAQKIKEIQFMAQHDCPPATPTSPAARSATLSSLGVSNVSFNHLKSALNDCKETNYKKIWEKQRMRKRVQHFLDNSFSAIVCDENALFDTSLECEPQPQQQQPTTTMTSSVRSSQMSTSSSQTTMSSNQSSLSANHTTGAVMPSPTLSSHSSSPSLSSSTTNSSDIQSTTSSSQQRMRLRFGVRDDTGLRKLLALSDNCVAVVHHNSHRPHSHHNDDNLSQNVSNHPNFSLPIHSHQFLSSHPSTTSRLSVPSFGLTSGVTLRLPSATLPEESSSVTSLRRLEQLQQLSRFREQFIPDFNQTNGSLVTTQQLATHQRQHNRIGRPLLPSYDQTIQRMKKKLNKNEENVV